MLITTSVIFVSILLFFLFKFFTQDNTFNVTNVLVSNADITEPKFAINSPTQKIHVTAKEGNFVENDKILLKKNVKFKSNNFSIISDNVLFDRKKQTAHSKEKSIFKSEKTIISSEGFDIYENGNRIKFYGNAVVILK